MHLLERTYDFGPMLPPGITVLAAVKYLLSTTLGLPSSGDFEEQYEKWYKDTLAEAFIEALEHLSVYPSYETAILSSAKGTYSEGPMNVASIYTDTIRTVATKIAASKPRTYTTESVYNAFLAVNILTNLLRSGKSDCREYLELLPFEVVDVYGVSKARSEFPDVEVVYGIYKRDGLDSLTLQVLESPRSVAALVRKRYFRAYVASLEKIKKQSIFTVYFEKVCKDHGSSLDTGLAQLATIPVDEQLQLVDRVSDLHDLGIIDTSVTLAIPSEKEIDEVEGYTPENDSAKPRKEVEIHATSGHIEKTILNYTRKVDVLHVDNIKFPSIAHYAYYCLSQKRYSAIVAEGKFIYPDISDPYVFLPPLNDYYYRVAHMNELEGLGRKFSEDLLSEAEGFPKAKLSEEKDSGGYELFVDKRIQEFAQLSRTILHKTRNWSVQPPTAVGGESFAPILIGAVEWAYEKRRYVSDEMSQLVGIYPHFLSNTSPEKTALIALSLGVCIPASINMAESLDKILFETCYKLMGSVLALSPLISPEKVIDYARRSRHPPRLTTKLPRAIAHPAIALNYILRILRPLEEPNYNITHAAINVLSGRRISDNLKPVYDDYSKILTLELGIDPDSAALVNGFIAEIPSMDNSDDVYRRIVFYANP
jgi:hypothetical protein